LTNGKPRIKIWSLLIDPLFYRIVKEKRGSLRTSREDKEVTIRRIKDISLLMFIVFASVRPYRNAEL
jgi:hypothetical protein